MHRLAFALVALALVLPATGTAGDNGLVYRYYAGYGYRFNPLLSFAQLENRVSVHDARGARSLCTARRPRRARWAQTRSTGRTTFPSAAVEPGGRRASCRRSPPSHLRGRLDSPATAWTLSAARAAFRAAPQAADPRRRRRVDSGVLVHGASHPERAAGVAPRARAVRANRPDARAAAAPPPRSSARRSGSCRSSISETGPATHSAAPPRTATTRNTTSTSSAPGGSAPPRADLGGGPTRGGAPDLNPRSAVIPDTRPGQQPRYRAPRYQVPIRRRERIWFGLGKERDQVSPCDELVHLLVGGTRLR